MKRVEKQLNFATNSKSAVAPASGHPHSHLLGLSMKKQAPFQLSTEEDAHLGAWASVYVEAKKTEN